jgi:acetyltransferase-like isoleucine patch superfamily enzyme
MIYTPTAMTLDLFHLYPLKAVHLQLFGAKLGKNVVTGGLVLDPSLLEAGDRSNIGGFSMILGHSVERGKIVFKKVTIGKNCGIGIRATVLPGVTLGDQALLGAQSLLTKNTQIPANETYGGIPAKKLSLQSEKR